MRRLRRLFGRDDGPPAIPPPLAARTAFVLLSESRLPSRAELTAALELYAGGDVHVDASDGVLVSAVSFSTGEKAVFGLVPAEIPDGEAQEHFDRSLCAFQPDFVAPGHTAHIVVFFTRPDGADAIRSTDRFTALLGALANSSPSVGVYIGGVVSHVTEYFLDVAADSSHSTRTLLWTGVSIATPSRGGVSLLSSGLPQLGLPDLLLESRTLPVADATQAFFDFLGYLLELGRPLELHETIGRTTDEKLRIKYSRSPVEAHSKVWHVEFP